MTLAFRSRERRKKIWSDSTKSSRRKKSKRDRHSVRHRTPQSFDECDDGASVVTPIRA
jgi:hypothetical protein